MGEASGTALSFSYRVCHKTLETAREEATFEFRSRWDLSTAWGPANPLQWATVVGLVDSASEENKARAVVEIYLEPRAIPITRLDPFDTTKTRQAAFRRGPRTRQPKRRALLRSPSASAAPRGRLTRLQRMMPVQRAYLKQPTGPYTTYTLLSTTSRELDDAACPSGRSGGGGGGGGGSSSGGHGTAAGAAPCDISTDLSSPGAAALGAAGNVPETIYALRVSGISAAAAAAGASGTTAVPTPPAAGGFPARASSPSAAGAGASALAQRFGGPQRPACAPPTPTHANLDGARLAGNTDGNAFYSLCYPDANCGPTVDSAACPSGRRAGGGGDGESAAAASRGGGGGAMGDEAGHPSWFTE